MSRILTVLVLAACVLAAADENSWLVYLRQAKALELRGEYEASRKTLLSLLESAGATGLDGTALGVICSNLGAVVEQLGDYISAEKYYLDSIRQFEKVESNSVNITRPQNNLATLYTVTGQYARAEKLLRRVLAIRVEINGAGHPDVAIVLGNLGQLFLERREYRAAEQYFEQALAIWRRQSGPPGPELGIVCSNLAKLQYELGHSGEAARLAAEAITILETAPRASFVARIAALVIAARIATSRSEYASAGGRLAEALRICEASVGIKDPRTAEVLLAQAELARHQNRKSEARHLERNAKTILSVHSRENLLGNTVEYRGRP